MYPSITKAPAEPTQEDKVVPDAIYALIKRKTAELDGLYLMLNDVNQAEEGIAAARERFLEDLQDMGNPLALLRRDLARRGATAGTDRVFALSAEEDTPPAYGVPATAQEIDKAGEQIQAVLDTVENAPKKRGPKPKSKATLKARRKAAAEAKAQTAPSAPAKVLSRRGKAAVQAPRLKKDGTPWGKGGPKKAKAKSRK